MKGPPGSTTEIKTAKSEKLRRPVFQKSKEKAQAWLGVIIPAGAYVTCYLKLGGQTVMRRLLFCQTWVGIAHPPINPWYVLNTYIIWGFQKKNNFSALCRWPCIKTQSCAFMIRRFLSQGKLLKVSESQKQFFLKLHCPNSDLNFWQISALASKMDQIKNTHILLH